MQPIIMGRPYINKKTSQVVAFTERIPIGGNIFRYMTSEGQQIPESELINFMLFSPNQDLELAESKSKLLADLSTIEGMNRNDLIIKKHEEDLPKPVQDEVFRSGYLNVPEMIDSVSGKTVIVETSFATYTQTEKHIQKDFKLLDMIKTNKIEVNRIIFDFDLPDLNFLTIFLQNVENEEDFLEQAKEYYMDLNRNNIEDAIEDFFDNLFKKQEPKESLQ